MKVEVIRSARRRKTVQARQVGGTLRISIPASMSAAEEEKWVTEMTHRMERKNTTEQIDLSERAARLARQYGLKTPKSIRWVSNQEWRWGSCTPADGTIRISSRLAKEPTWVVDYVIVHELAHLSHAGHGKAFWDMVYRYPLTERARGFLIARSKEEEDDDDDDGGDGGDDDHASDLPRPGREVREDPEVAIDESAPLSAGKRPARFREGSRVGPDRDSNPAPPSPARPRAGVGAGFAIPGRLFW